MVRDARERVRRRRIGEVRVPGIDMLDLLLKADDDGRRTDAAASAGGGKPRMAEAVAESACTSHWVDVTAREPLEVVL